VLPTLAVDARLVGGSLSYARIFKGSDVPTHLSIWSVPCLTNLEHCWRWTFLGISSDWLTHHNSIKATGVSVIHGSFGRWWANTCVILQWRGLVSKLVALVDTSVHSFDQFGLWRHGLSIQTPFLSSTTDSLIEFPVNVPLAGWPVRTITSSDGTSIKMPVDTAQVLRSSVLSSIWEPWLVNEWILVLSYTVGADEVAPLALSLSMKSSLSPNVWLCWRNKTVLMRSSCLYFLCGKELLWVTRRVGSA
jgi:hypothetical protein